MGGGRARRRGACGERGADAVLLGCAGDGGMSFTLTMPPPTVEWSGEEATEYTRTPDPQAAYRARLILAARGRYGRLSQAGRLLVEHGDGARRALRAIGGDAAVDALLAEAGVAYSEQLVML